MEIGVRTVEANYCYGALLDLTSLKHRVNADDKKNVLFSTTIDQDHRIDSEAELQLRREVGQHSWRMEP